MRLWAALQHSVLQVFQQETLLGDHPLWWAPHGTPWNSPLGRGAIQKETYVDGESHLMITWSCWRGGSGLKQDFPWIPTETLEAAAPSQQAGAHGCSALTSLAAGTSQRARCTSEQSVLVLLQRNRSVLCTWSCYIADRKSNRQYRPVLKPILFCKIPVIKIPATWVHSH